MAFHYLDFATRITRADHGNSERDQTTEIFTDSDSGVDILVFSQRVLRASDY